MRARRGRPWVAIRIVSLLSACTCVMAGHVVTRLSIASLDQGSLAGTKFRVSFSFDADQVTALGDSFVQLQSFDFTLLGVAFTRTDIFQGGQAIFRNGTLTNVTASFQVRLPPNAPLLNITFGFGGDGVIGYIDRQNQFGIGSFVFAAANIAVNAASFAAGQPLAPGSLAAIMGSGFGLSTARAGSIPLPLELGEISVTIAGVPAPLLYVSPAQINLQIPWSLSAGPAEIVVMTGSLPLPPLQASIGLFSPGIFSTQAGAGQAFAANLDGSIAAPTGSVPGFSTHPAKPGDYIVILATGLGAVNPPIADGVIPTDRLRFTLATPQVFINGVPAKVTFSGLAPQYPGVNQINAIVPPLPAGVVPLQIEIGGIRTSSRVSIALGSP